MFKKIGKGFGGIIGVGGLYTVFGPKKVTTGEGM
jgi:hypothetical protein